MSSRGLKTKDFTSSTPSTPRSCARRSSQAARCSRTPRSPRAVHRYYDTATDQFLSVDPDVTQTGQAYAFAGGDPLNFSDPLGLAEWCMQGTSHNYTGPLYAFLYGANNGVCSFGEYGDSCYWKDWKCIGTATFSSPFAAAEFDEEWVAYVEALKEEALAQYTANHPVQISPALVYIANVANSVGTNLIKYVPEARQLGDCANGVQNFWFSDGGATLAGGEGLAFGVSLWVPIEPEAQAASAVVGGTILGCTSGVLGG